MRDGKIEKKNTYVIITNEKKKICIRLQFLLKPLLFAAVSLRIGFSNLEFHRLQHLQMKIHLHLSRICNIALPRVTPAVRQLVDQFFSLFSSRCGRSWCTRVCTYRRVKREIDCLGRMSKKLTFTPFHPKALQKWSSHWNLPPSKLDHDIKAAIATIRSSVFGLLSSYQLYFQT